jgi:hypothetical protein
MLRRRSQKDGFTWDRGGQEPDAAPLAPWPQVFGYVDDELDGDRGPQTVMWSKEFYETDPSRSPIRQFPPRFPPTPRVVLLRIGVSEGARSGRLLISMSHP